MHNSRKVFLADPEPRCIMAVYNKDEKPKEFKTFDQTIEVDDFIVVPTSTRLAASIMLVTAIDVEPDLESEVAIQWVIDKVDASLYDATVKSEKEFLDVALKAERKRKKEQLRKDFMAGSSCSLEALPSYVTDTHNINEDDTNS